MPLERLLERQAGVVTVAQAVATGMSADSVRRRVRDGRWETLHPRVHLAGGHRLTDEARVWAAWLWAGERATVCGPAAAFRLGMLGAAPDVVDVVLPAALHRRPVPGIRLHRHDLPHVDRVPSGRAVRDRGDPRRLIAATGAEPAGVRHRHRSRRSPPRCPPADGTGPDLLSCPDTQP